MNGSLASTSLGEYFTVLISARVVQVQLAHSVWFISDVVS